MRIKVLPEKMTEIASSLKRLSDEFDGIIRDINSIVKSIDWELRSKEGVDQKASDAIRVAKKISGSLESMAKDLEFARDRMIEEDKKHQHCRENEECGHRSFCGYSFRRKCKSCGCELYIGLQNLGPGRANCPNTFVGDPVNVTTGNFYVTKKDIQIPQEVFP